MNENSDLYEEYNLPKGEYMEGSIDRYWIFLHHTAGGDNPYSVINGWKNDTRGPIGTEFVIGGRNASGAGGKYDGKILHAFPETGFAWHLGTGNNPLHKDSVAIEMCNFGWVHDGKTYVGSKVAESEIVTLSKPYRGYTHWQDYSDNELKSLKRLLEFIGNRNNIDLREGLPALIRKKGADAINTFDPSMCSSQHGIWSHSNVRKDKFDVYPNQKLIDLLLSF